VQYACWLLPLMWLVTVGMLCRLLLLVLLLLWLVTVGMLCRLLLLVLLLLAGCLLQAAAGCPGMHPRPALHPLHQHSRSPALCWCWLCAVLTMQ
jgi:hypothetical protein